MIQVLSTAVARASALFVPGKGWRRNVPRRTRNVPMRGETVGFLSWVSGAVLTYVIVHRQLRTPPLLPAADHWVICSNCHRHTVLGHEGWAHAAQNDVRGQTGVSHAAVRPSGAQRQAAMALRTGDPHPHPREGSGHSASDACSESRLA